jgi:hypothetical protein
MVHAKLITDEDMLQGNVTLVSQKSNDSNRSGTELWAAAKTKMKKKVWIYVLFFYYIEQV